MLKYLIEHRYNRIDLVGWVAAGHLFISGAWVAGVVTAVVMAFISAALERHAKKVASAVTEHGRVPPR